MLTRIKMSKNTDDMLSAKTPTDKFKLPILNQSMDISNGSVFFRKNIINNAAEKINPTIFAVIDEKIIVFLDTENFLKCPEKAIIAAKRERMNINKILSVKNSIIL